MTDNERLTILEMEYRIVAGRLNVIEAELGRINGRLDQLGDTMNDMADDISNLRTTAHGIDARTAGTERAVTALLRHFKIDQGGDGT